MIQFRNAFNLGGLYWSANLILSQASVVACGVLYHLHYEDDLSESELGAITLLNGTSTNSTATKITETQLKTSVVGLFGISLVSFTLFMLKIERKYVKTFFTTETAHTKSKSQFLKGENDYRRSLIFGNNKRLWMSIRPQVGEWLDANWDKWERDKPEWFNALFLDKVDDDIMPARVLARLKQEAEGGVRRRSSLLDRMSVRLEEEKVVEDEEEESD